jgi:hypothetical protein
MAAAGERSELRGRRQLITKFRSTDTDGIAVMPPAVLRVNGFGSRSSVRVRFTPQLRTYRCTHRVTRTATRRHKDVRVKHDSSLVVHKELYHGFIEFAGFGLRIGVAAAWYQ